MVIEIDFNSDEAIYVQLMAPAHSDRSLNL